MPYWHAAEGTLGPWLAGPTSAVGASHSRRVGRRVGRRLSRSHRLLRQLLELSAVEVILKWLCLVVLQRQCHLQRRYPRLSRT